MKLTKTAEKALEKLSDEAGYDDVDRYLTDRILMMLVDKITAPDIKSTKQLINETQAKLNKKREEIMNELKEKKRKEE